MNIISLFISHAKSSLLEQPRERCLHDPADLSESAAVFSVAFRNHGCDSPTAQRFAYLLFRIIRPICVNRFGTLARTALGTLDGLDRIDQSHGHFGVVDVGPCVFDGHRSTVAVHNQMALRAVFAPICGIRPRFLPPKRART